MIYLSVQNKVTGIVLDHFRPSETKTAQRIVDRWRKEYLEELEKENKLPTTYKEKRQLEDFLKENFKYELISDMVLNNEDHKKRIIENTAKLRLLKEQMDKLVQEILAIDQDHDELEDIYVNYYEDEDDIPQRVRNDQFDKATEEYEELIHYLGIRYDVFG